MGFVPPERLELSLKHRSKRCASAYSAKGVFNFAEEVRFELTEHLSAFGAFQEHCTKPLYDSSKSSPPWDSKWVDLSVFYFLKTCWSYPLKTSNTTGRDCVSPFIPRCPTRAVDILRNHSLGLDSKTVEYLLLITFINPLIGDSGHHHHLFFLKKCFLPLLSPTYPII